MSSRDYSLIRLCLLTALFVLAVPTSVSASSTIVLPGRPVARDPNVFAAIDLDNDGRVTEAEYVKYTLRRRFESADVDKDGKLSKAEYLASIKNEPGGHPIEVDWKALNGGKEFITLDEFVRHGGAAKEISDEFKKLDRNGRGYLTMADWTKDKRRSKRTGSPK